jgi:hypothetical protein
MNNSAALFGRCSFPMLCIGVKSLAISELVVGGFTDEFRCHPTQLLSRVLEQRSEIANRVIDNNYSILLVNLLGTVANNKTGMSC